MDSLSNRRAKDVIPALKQRLKYGDLSGIQTHPDWEIFRDWDNEHRNESQCLMINHKLRGLVKVTLYIATQSRWYPTQTSITTVAIKIHDMCVFNNNLLLELTWTFPDMSLIELAPKIKQDWNAAKMEYLL